MRQLEVGKTIDAGQEYLSLIENHFVEERSRFSSSGLSLEEYLASGSLRLQSDLAIAKGRRALSSTEYKAEAFRDDIRSFWDKHSGPLQAAIGNDSGMSVCVWGDMDLPVIVPRYAVYFDTVFIPDGIPYYANPEKRGLSPAAYVDGYFAWTVLLSRWKNLMLADADPLPVIIYPQRFSMGGPHETSWVKKRVEHLEKLASTLTYHYMSETLGLEASEPVGLSLFETALFTDLDLLGRRLEQSDLPEFLGPMFQQIDNFPTIGGKGYEGLLSRISRGKVTRRDLQRIFGLVQSHFYFLESREENARHLHSDNALADMGWVAAKRKNNLLVKRLNATLEPSEPRIVAVSFERRFKWLDNLTDEDIIRIREHSGLQELRRLLDIDRRLLKQAAAEDFEEVAREYEASVLSRLDAFSAELLKAAEKLTRKRRKALASFAVSAGLGAASLALPTLLVLSLLSFAYGTVVGGSSIWDLIDGYRDDPDKEKEIRERPITLLLQAYTSGSK
jgi:hypothetical protein